MQTGKQNITLSLPKDLLLQVKHLAIERGTSLSGLLMRYITEMLRQEDGYTKAMKRAKVLMKKGYNMGTKGQVRWKRSDLYDR